MIKFLIQRPIAVLMAFTACFIVGLVTYFTLSFAATWMGLDIVTVNEVSQTEKEKYFMISLISRTFTYCINELIYKIEIEPQM